MKANELRVGNWVTINKAVNQQVTEIHSSGWLRTTSYCIYDMGNEQGPNVPDGIPLTEEWLLRLGFQSNPYEDRYELGDIDVECDKTKGYTELWLAGHPHIKHVHQLQNLYFALTGEELQIKEE